MGWLQVVFGEKGDELCVLVTGYLSVDSNPFPDSNRNIRREQITRRSMYRCAHAFPVASECFARS